MGHLDKAALDLGGRTLLDRVLGAARPVCDRLVVVGPSRPTSVDGVEFVTEAAPGGGPVPAVAAGLDLVPDAETIVVLAVDLPLLGRGDLVALVRALEQSSSDAAAASDDRGRPNPLLAAYRAHCLRAGAERLGADAAGAAAAALLPRRTATVDLGPVATLNVNRPADLDRARALLEAAARSHRPAEQERGEPLDWPQRYAAALAQASGGELTLPDEEVDAVLDLARDVAHGSERRHAPLSTYLAGRFVARRAGAGVPAREALEEAVAVARRLLEEHPGGTPPSVP